MWRNVQIQFSGQKCKCPDLKARRNLAKLGTIANIFEHLFLNFWASCILRKKCSRHCNVEMAKMPNSRKLGNLPVIDLYPLPKHPLKRGMYEEDMYSNPIHKLGAIPQHLTLGIVTFPSCNVNWHGFVPKWTFFWWISGYLTHGVPWQGTQKSPKKSWGLQVPQIGCKCHFRLKTFIFN